MDQEAQNELFDLLGKIQSYRLNEQRCDGPILVVKSKDNDTQKSFPDDTAMPENFNTKKEDNIDIEPVKKVLGSGGPYPLVVLPVTGEYWLEGSNHQYAPEDIHKRIPSYDSHKWCIEKDMSVEFYRKYFLGKEHFNFMCDDDKVGPIILSIKQENTLGEESQGFLRVVLRTSEKSIADMIPVENLSENLGPREIIKYLLGDEIDAVEQFQAIAYTRASEAIVKFDEHMNHPKFKFGVIYQQFGQIREEEYFNNKTHGSAMNEFLDLLGARVCLKDFKGFNGGLDVKHGQTGETSVHTVFGGNEIMFHVSTLLPYSNGDSQQVQRKRHIGNDIVSIVFQDKNTPFSPVSIRSHFLHVFIVVQVENPNTSNTRYKVSVTAKDDVPQFGPKLPNPAVFKKGPEFRQFLLTKLINAEKAALKSADFSRLADRTRSMLLKNLFDELQEKNFAMFDMAAQNEASGNPKGILTSLRKAIRGRTSPVSRTVSMNSTRSSEDPEANDESQANNKKNHRRKSTQSFLSKKKPKEVKRSNSTRSKSMESLETELQNVQTSGSSTFFITHSPRTSRAYAHTEPRTSREKTQHGYLIAKPINPPEHKFGFHRAASTPMLDQNSYSNKNVSNIRTQNDHFPKPGVQYMGGYSSNPEFEQPREQSPVKIIDYERSPNSSRRSSDPFEIIRPDSRLADEYYEMGKRLRNLDYTGEYEKELIYLPKQLQQVTQQIHQQHKLSHSTNPKSREYNTAMLLSYRRSQEDLLDSRTPPESPNTSRKGYDRGVSSPVVLRHKKTAVVTPLLEQNSRPHSVPPGLLLFDPTDPESEGYKQVLEQTLSVSNSSQDGSSRSLNDKDEELENLKKQVESLTTENVRLRNEKSDLERQLVLVERENKEAEDQNLHQTVELYEARCEIARLRSLLPSENVRSEKVSERSTSRHTRL